MSVTAINEATGCEEGLLVDLCVQLDEVLAAMDRMYTRDEYMRRIDWIRSAKRKYALTTDIIIGFPGETEADFEQTLQLLEEVQYDSLFSFKYSEERRLWQCKTKCPRKRSSAA